MVSLVVALVNQAAIRDISGTTGKHQGFQEKLIPLNADINPDTLGRSVGGS